MVGSPIRFLLCLLDAVYFELDESGGQLELQACPAGHAHTFPESYRQLGTVRTMSRCLQWLCAVDPDGTCR